MYRGIRTLVSPELHLNSCCSWTRCWTWLLQFIEANFEAVYFNDSFVDLSDAFEASTSELWISMTSGRLSRFKRLARRKNENFEWLAFKSTMILPPAQFLLGSQLIFKGFLSKSTFELYLQLHFGRIRCLTISWT